MGEGLQSPKNHPGMQALVLPDMGAVGPLAWAQVRLLIPTYVSTHWVSGITLGTGFVLVRHTEPAVKALPLQWRKRQEAP